MKSIGDHQYFCQRFLLTIDKKLEEFIFSEKDIAALQWISKEELARQFMQTPEKFGPSNPKILKLFGII